MMTTSWRKVEDKNGFAYYLNESSNFKQWDHPRFADIRQRLDDCNYVKYSMYRVALKFRVLQNALHMEEVPLSTIAGVFERHRLGANESSLCLESCDLEAVLSDIYFASNKIRNTNIDVDFATELMLNFLYNIYDKYREGTIQVSSTKVALSILSSCSMNEFHKFIFDLCADHNNCVTRLRLQVFLSKIVEITTFLHEEGSYGFHLVSNAIENCFSSSPGLVGINESMFLNWVEGNPKILSWIPLLHRIKIAEPVLHTIKCTTCKTNPLMGLRYKCIKCLRYTQCQRCFFTGRTSHSHKLSHSMREYCSGGTDHGYTLMKKFCSLLNCSKRNGSIVVDPKPLCSDQNRLVTSDSKEVLCDVEPLFTPPTQLELIIRQLEMQNKELHSDQNRLVTSDSKEGLCDVEPLSTPPTQLELIIRQLEMQNKELHSDQNRLVTSDSKEVLCDVEPLSTPQTQLELIIRQLEMQNKELQQILLMGSSTDKEMRRYLEEHRIHVAAQIQKLKNLKDFFIKPSSAAINSKNSFRKKAIESTPMLQSTYRTDRIVREGLELFSPIVSIPEDPSRVDSTELFLEDATNSSKGASSTSAAYCIDDMSTWIGGLPVPSNKTVHPPKNLPGKSPVRELHNDLDEALAKLQQILANNFCLDESLGHVDNTNLKYAVSEVEGMLTSFIDTVEHSRANSARSHRLRIETDASEKV